MLWNVRLYESTRYGMRTCSIQGLSCCSTGIVYNRAHSFDRWYAEDCSRLPGLNRLKKVGRTFATSIVGLSWRCSRAWRYQHFSPSLVYQTFLIAPLWMPGSKAGKRKLRESLIPWKMRDSGYRRPFCARHAPIQMMRVGLLIRLYGSLLD
jgi:hypothetical protein